MLDLILAQRINTVVTIYRKGFPTLLVLLVLFSTSMVYAEEPEFTLGGEDVPEEVLSGGENAGDKFEQVQRAWSERVTSTASYMDQFFDNDQYKGTSNKTYLRLRVTPRYNQDGFSLDNYVDIRLRLPNTERWLVTFGGDPDDEERYGSTPLESTERSNSSSNESNGYIGINTFLTQKRTRNIGTGGGVRFRNRAIVPYLTAKWVELWEFDKWDIRLTERLRYYTDTGLEWKNQLDFDWPLAKKFFARSSGAITFEQGESVYNFDIYYSLYQYLSTRRALLYKISTGYTDKPERSTYLSTVNYEVQYRMQWRDWFYTTIIPQMYHGDYNDWELDAGIRLDFNFILGYTKKHTFKSKFDNKQERLRQREWEKMNEEMQKLNKPKEEK